MRVLKPNTSRMVQAAWTKPLLKLAKKVKMTGNTKVCPNSRRSEEQRRRDEHERQRQALLAGVEPGRHEGPGLPEGDR